VVFRRTVLLLGAARRRVVVFLRAAGFLLATFFRAIVFPLLGLDRAAFFLRVVLRVLVLARPEALRFADRLLLGRRGFITTTSESGISVAL
jgi:hypothetical protein